MKNIFIVPLMGLLASCAFQTEPVSTPQLSIVSSFAEPIKGKYLLYVDSQELNKEVRPSEPACAFHRYPLNMTSAFSGSVHQTFKNVFQEIELVDNPVPSGQLTSRGAKGMIVVRGRDLNTRFVVIPGFFQNNIEIDVEMSASVTIDGPKGRLYGRSDEGDHQSRGPAGIFCSGGSDVLAQSSQQALKELVGKLAEGASNSPELR